tara:strand:+ start:423 stop:818 length:396 start_codon:yes stop_codon:yes gene_type:complete
MNKRGILIFFCAILIVLLIVFFIKNYLTPHFEGIYIYEKNNETIELTNEGVYFRKYFFDGKSRIDTGKWWVGEKSHIWLTNWVPDKRDREFFKNDSSILIGVPFERSINGNVKSIVINRDLNKVYKRDKTN